MTITSHSVNNGKLINNSSGKVEGLVDVSKLGMIDRAQVQRDAELEGKFEACMEPQCERAQKLGKLRDLQEGIGTAVELADAGFTPDATDVLATMAGGPGGTIANKARKAKKGADAANEARNVRRASDAVGAQQDLSKVTIDSKTVLSGGRGGSKVKGLIGPPNAAVRCGGERAFITNDKGQVILDITKNRVKPVNPGQGFGPKRAPTQQELDILQRVLEGGS